MTKPNSLVSIAISCKGFYQCAKRLVYFLFLPFSENSNKLWEAAFSSAVIVCIYPNRLFKTLKKLPMFMNISLGVLYIGL